MKKTLSARLWLLLLLCCSALFAGAQTVANKEQIISRARNAYYNLKREGLDSFTCRVTPNWGLLLQKQHEEDPYGADKAIQTLSQLEFTVDVASDNSVKLMHNDLTDQSDEMMEALKQIYGGMEQMASGFFETWKLFVLSAPFPQVSSHYELQAQGPQYSLTYSEGTEDIVTTMARDFAISNVKITGPEFDSSIKPSLTKDPKGFLLSGYEASYQSQKPEEATKLKVLIDYEPVEGFQMLHKLNLSGSYGGSPFAVELKFSDCKVTKK